MSFRLSSHHISSSIPLKNPDFSLNKFLAFTTSSSSAQKLLTHLQKQRSNIEQTLNTVKAKVDTPCVFEVLKWCSLDRPQVGLRFFIWAGIHFAFRPSAYTYNQACKFLEIKQNPGIIFDLFEAYRRENCVLNVKMFKVVFNLCKEAKDANLALWVLKKMKECGFRPDTTSYNLVIRLFCEKGQMGEVMGLMKEMSLIELYPDMITYVSVIKGYCEVGRLEDACNLIKAMKGHGCSPNAVIYSALLDGVSRFSSSERAEELLREMQNEGGDCKPNVVSYTSVIQGFVKNGRLSEALRILNQMQSYGCKPNRVTISTLITGLCKEGQIKEAYKVIDEVAGTGLTKDECYSSLVLALSRTGNSKEAEVVLRKMLATGLKPDCLASGTVIKCLCFEGRALDGYHLYDGVEKCGSSCSMDSDVYSILLAGLCQENLAAKAANLAMGMVEKQIRLQTSYIDQVVGSLEKFGEHELACRLLKCNRQR